MSCCQGETHGPHQNFMLCPSGYPRVSLSSGGDGGVPPLHPGMTHRHWMSSSSPVGQLSPPQQPGMHGEECWKTSPLPVPPPLVNQSNHSGENFFCKMKVQSQVKFRQCGQSVEHSKNPQESSSFFQVSTMDKGGKPQPMYPEHYPRLPCYPHQGLKHPRALNCQQATQERLPYPQQYQNLPNKYHQQQPGFSTSDTHQEAPDQQQSSLLTQHIQRPSPFTFQYQQQQHLGRSFHPPHLQYQDMERPFRTSHNIQQGHEAQPLLHSCLIKQHSTRYPQPPYPQYTIHQPHQQQLGHLRKTTAGIAPHRQQQGGESHASYQGSQSHDQNQQHYPPRKQFRSPQQQYQSPQHQSQSPQQQIKSHQRQPHPSQQQFQQPQPPQQQFQQFQPPHQQFQQFQPPQQQFQQPQPPQQQFKQPQPPQQQFKQFQQSQPPQQQFQQSQPPQQKFQQPQPPQQQFQLLQQQGEFSAQPEVICISPEPPKTTKVNIQQLPQSSAASRRYEDQQQPSQGQEGGEHSNNLSKQTDHQENHLLISLSLTQQDSMGYQKTCKYEREIQTDMEVMQFVNRLKETVQSQPSQLKDGGNDGEKPTRCQHTTIGSQQHEENRYKNKVLQGRNLEAGEPDGRESQQTQENAKGSPDSHKREQLTQKYRQGKFARMLETDYSTPAKPEVASSCRYSSVTSSKHMNQHTPETPELNGINSNPSMNQSVNHSISNTRVNTSIVSEVRSELSGVSVDPGVSCISDRNPINTTSLSLTPPPTPPIFSLIPKPSSTVSEVIPDNHFMKQLFSVFTNKITSGEAVDMKTDTLTNSFMEPTTPYGEDPTAAMKDTAAVTEHTPSVITHTYSTVDHMFATSKHTPAPIVLSLNIPQVSLDFPEATHGTSGGFTILDAVTSTPQGSPKLQESTSTTGQTQLKDINIQGRASPCVTTIAQPFPRSLTMKSRLKQSYSKKNPEKEDICGDLCLNARFSMYLPPQLEFPCLLCGIIVPSEEAIYHLFFGQIKCAACKLSIKTCWEFRSMEILDIPCEKETTGEHKYLEWSSDPTSFVSYHMSKSLVTRNFYAGKDTSPSTTDLISTMAKFLKKFSALEHHSPWEQAIRKCWKFVRNMQSMTNLTKHHLKQRRKKSFDKDCENSVGLSKTNTSKNKPEETVKAESESSVPWRIEKTQTLTSSEDIKEVERTLQQEETKINAGKAYILSISEENILTVEAEEASFSSAGDKQHSEAVQTVGHQAERKLSFKSPVVSPRSTIDTMLPVNSDQAILLNTSDPDVAKNTFEENLESPDMQSKFGDFLLSLPYNQDMLEKVIQYVSLFDDEVKEDSDVSKASPTANIRDLSSITAQDQSLIVNSASTTKQSPSRTKDSTSGCLQERQCIPRKTIRKSMPKSRKKRFLDAYSSELNAERDPAPPQDATQNSGGQILDGDNFLLYNIPSCQVPEECPMCYTSICPTIFTINIKTFRLKGICPGCDLIIYLVQDPPERSFVFKKPGSKEQDERDTKTQLVA